MISFISMELEIKLERCKNLSADRRDTIFKLRRKLQVANELARERKKSMVFLERQIQKMGGVVE